MAKHNNKVEIMLENLRFLIQQNVNAILLNSTFADKINPYAKISEITTFGPSDEKLIKERLKSKFKLNIHQDISDFTVNQLYTMIFLFVQNSKISLNLSIQNEIPQIKQPKHNHTQSAPSTDEPLWNRNMIFGYILKSIRTICGRNVQSTEKIAHLVQEAQNTGMNPDALINELKELENFFDIKIDQSMRIYNIGNLAEKSFIAQGKAVDSRVTQEQMDPLWATIHTVIPMGYWQSVILNELNVRISTYKLSRIKSFNEFEQLVAEAKQRKER